MRYALRFLPPVFLLVGCGVAWHLLVRQATEQRKLERQEAARLLQQTAVEAAEAVARAVAQRNAEREAVRNDLQKRAEALALTVQTRLVAAAADAEADTLRRRLALAEQNRKALTATVRQQTDLLQQVQQTLVSLREEMAKTASAPSLFGRRRSDTTVEIQPDLLTPDPLESAPSLETPAVLAARDSLPTPALEADILLQTPAAGSAVEADAALIQTAVPDPQAAEVFAALAEELQQQLGEHGRLRLVTKEGDALLELGAAAPASAQGPADSAAAGPDPEAEPRVLVGTAECGVRALGEHVLSVELNAAEPPAPFAESDGVAALSDLVRPACAIGQRLFLLTPQGAVDATAEVSAEAEPALALPQRDSWLQSGHRPDRWVYLATAQAVEPSRWGIGLQGVLDDPEPAERAALRLAAHPGTVALVVLPVLALTLLPMLLPSLRPSARSEVRTRREPERTGRSEKVRRLARHEQAARPHEEASLLVADSGEETGDQPRVAVRPAARRRETIRSLARLQAQHRGHARQEGSRILDHARSPILRELVQRVRPKKDGESARLARPGSATPARSGREGER